MRNIFEILKQIEQVLIEDKEYTEIRKMRYKSY